MSAYATTADLAEYMFVAEETLPADAERLLARASEDVSAWTMGRVDTNDETHAEAAKNATCCLAADWAANGEPGSTATASDTIKGFSIDGFSMSYADSNAASAASKAAAVTPTQRARNYLKLAGLLYAGVRMR